MKTISCSKIAVTACFVVSVFLAPAKAASLYTIDLVNDNADVMDLWVTFRGSAFSSAPQWSGGQTISLDTSYQVSQSNVGTMINNMPTDWGGNLYIGNSDTSGAAAPNPTNFNTDQYQIIEFAGSGTSAAPDITYINFYSFPVELHSTDTVNTSSTRGTPKAGVNLSNLRTDLANLTSSTNNTPSNSTVVRGINPTSAGNILRVIGPPNGTGPNGSVVDKYPTFSAYLNNIFPNNSPISSINIDNTYSGEQSPPNVRFEPQDYSISSISYDTSTGALVLNGSSTEVGNSTTKIDSFSLTSTVDVASFSESIYQAVLDYDYSYMETSTSSPVAGSGNTGSNDVFATITRDLLAGFSFGFIGSALYGSDTSAEWQTNTTEYYGDLWPANQEFYNLWADVFQEYFDDVYTQQFSDFLSSSAFTPTIQVGEGETLTITLLDETAFVPELSSTSLLVGCFGVFMTLGRRRR